jgi:hypothetical protein
MPVEMRERAAKSAIYIGSPEHKLPNARNDATICPPDFENRTRELNEWLRRAIRDGHVGGMIEGQYPRYVWLYEENRFFEGRLTNQELGEYKGYPITPEEAPDELRAPNV